MIKHQMDGQCNNFGPHHWLYGFHQGNEVRSGSIAAKTEWQRERSKK